MATAEQWDDVERAFRSLEKRLAEREARLIRWIVGAVAGGVGAMGLLLGILEAVR